MRLPEPDQTIRTRRVVTHDATITRIRRLTHDTFEVVVKLDDDRRRIDAHAGQFLTLKVPVIAKPRPYSLARAPASEAPGEHTFFIRLVPDGEMSTWLAGDDRAGARIEVTGPLGTFGLDDSDAALICIAGGSGMSAINAILEHACNQNVARDCHFVYGARTRRDLYGRDNMQHVRDRWHPEYVFDFIEVLSEEPIDSDWQGARGLVTDYLKRELIGRGVLHPGRTKAYLCGPPPMIDAAIGVLREAGMDGADIFFDRFEDAGSPAPVIDNLRCVLCDECLLVKPVENCIVEASNLTLATDGEVTGFERILPGHSSGLYYNGLFIDEAECIRCYACVGACPHDAISPNHDRVVNTLRQRTP